MHSKILFGLVLVAVSMASVANPVRVARVIDGDTFETAGGEKVRMIGINSPESSDVFGPEATRHLEYLIVGKDVTLVSDEKSSNRDRYQRLLRYVEIGDSDINLRMIYDGFAFAYLKYSFSRSKEYRVAQVSATQRRAGMWQAATSPQELHEIHDKQLLINSKAIFIMSLVILLVAISLWSLLRR